MPSHENNAGARAASEQALKRREMLLYATTAVVAIGLGAISPFVASLGPSAAALAAAAPMEVDVSSLAPGQPVIEEWRCKPSPPSNESCREH